MYWYSCTAVFCAHSIPLQSASVMLVVNSAAVIPPLILACNQVYDGGCGNCVIADDGHRTGCGESTAEAVTSVDASETADCNQFADGCVATKVTEALTADTKASL